MAGTRHTLEFSATCEGVRTALDGLRSGYLNHAVGASLGGTAELVLAEVLNNVVEHAMADRREGRVRLTMTHDQPFLAIDLRDDGAPMPGLTLPSGTPPCVDTSLDDLPEGGFGWHLIRTLTQGLEYQRENGWNRLTFQLSDEQAL